MDVSALLGGMLIGVSAAILWAFNGRIAGVSGMLSALSEPPQSARWPFVLGLVAAGLMVGQLTALPTPISNDIPTHLGAGVLVGVGTFFANGCTSGHGVCGISRLSRRSIVATLVFMGTAALTVFVRGLT